MKNKKIYWPLQLLTFVFGLVVAFTLLSGDDSGRVNLLYLLLLYFFVPVAGALLSLYALFSSSKFHTAQWLVQLGIFKLNRQPFFQQLRRMNQDRTWLLQQSQIMAMMFAVASILALFIILLFSDIAFVWRSTLLTHEHVYALLKIIASPWYFWSQAQPDLSLLQATQDYRLTNNAINPEQAGQWWLFILATQLFYSVCLRGVIFAFLQLRLGQAESDNASVEKVAVAEADENTYVYESPGVLHEIDDYSAVFYWHVIPQEIVNLLDFTDELASVPADAWQGTEGEISLLQATMRPLVIVKGWEPPMAEMADVMAGLSGYVLILNWRDGQLLPVSDIQKDEWARFCQSHNWQLLIEEGAGNGE